jgi:hypothetical protein
MDGRFFLVRHAHPWQPASVVDFGTKRPRVRPYCIRAKKGDDEECAESHSGEKYTTLEAGHRALSSRPGCNGINIMLFNRLMADEENYPEIIAAIVERLLHDDREGATLMMAGIASPKREPGSRRRSPSRALKIQVWRRDHWTCLYCASRVQARWCRPWLLLRPSMRTLGGEVAEGRWGRSPVRWQVVGTVRSRWRCCIRVLYGYARPTPREGSIRQRAWDRWR